MTAYTYYYKILVCIKKKKKKGWHCVDKLGKMPQNEYSRSLVFE